MGFLEMLAGPFATAAAQLKHAESGRPNARGAQCRLLARLRLCAMSARPLLLEVKRTCPRMSPRRAKISGGPGGYVEKRRPVAATPRKRLHFYQQFLGCQKKIEQNRAKDWIASLRS